MSATVNVFVRAGDPIEVRRSDYTDRIIVDLGRGEITVFLEPEALARLRANLADIEVPV